jgi:hypothetical protein
MHDFLFAFLGGTLLGLSAVGYLHVNGRIAGVSSLIAQVLNLQTIFKTPALWFYWACLWCYFLWRCATAKY